MMPARGSAGIQFSLKVMDFALKVMDFALQMMNFVFK